MAATPPASTRLISLDALRGFTMFWILGADAAVIALARWLEVPPLPFLAHQVDHAAWAGFRFYDLIFPMFVFITGVSLTFSLEKSLKTSPRTVIVRRILVRTALLFLLGVVYNGGLSQPWPAVRLAGVLQRIALAYGASALLYCFVSARIRGAVTALVLVGYWAVLALVPIREIALDREAMAQHFGTAEPTAEQVRSLYDATTTTVTGRYEPGLNVAHHLDYHFLPGAKYDVYWDPEGILSTLPAIGTCLLGVMAGGWLRRRERSDTEKLRQIALAGVACLALGWIWDLQFPVVKKLWTSSYVLVAGGWSLLFLASFYWLIEVRNWRRWSTPFVWIGMNPITLYLATSLVSFGRIATVLSGGSVALWLDATFGTGASGCVHAMLVLLLLIALARFLDSRKIYLKV